MSTLTQLCLLALVSSNKHYNEAGHYGIAGLGRIDEADYNN